MKFIDDYIAYAKSQTAAPPIYNFFMAYALLATVIGRRATYHGAGGKKGCNLWFVVIGKSSMAFKSTMFNIGIDIMREVYRDRTNSIMLPNDGSYESFIEELSENAHGFIAHDEFANFMEWQERTYNAGLTGLLTTLYDGPDMFTRRVGTRDKKRLYEIKEPLVNIFCCSTIDWFSKHLTEERIMGGFLYRFCLVKNTSDSTCIPRTLPRNESLRNELVWALEKIKNMPLGPMDYTPDAGAKFDAWYKDWLWPRMKDATPLTASLYSRRATDTHKFAMIHAILRGDTSRMNLDDLDQAIQITKSLIAGGEEILNKEVSLNENASARNKIISIIKERHNGNGGVPRSVVMRYSRMSKREFDDAIATLLESDIIAQDTHRAEGVDKPTTFYKMN